MTASLRCSETQRSAVNVVLWMDNAGDLGDLSAMRTSLASGQLELFVACAPGLEPLLANEIAAVLPGAADALQTVAGGVQLVGDVSVMMRLNLHCGLAIRVLVRVAEFRVTKLAELRRKVAKLPWKQLLGPANLWQVRATCKRSRLYHSKAVEQRVDAAIADHVKRLQGEGDGVVNGHRVMVRIIKDRCTLSLDTSGDALHRRGWRQQTGKAPLREDLARALLVVSGWDRRSPLIDPMMGSATIVIEAALMAANVAPGMDRSFGFQQTALVDRPKWEQLHDAARSAQVDATDVMIFGRDRMEGALNAARGNATRAGVLGRLQLSQADLRDTALPSDIAQIVSNPPYGHRIAAAKGAMSALGKRIAQLPGAADVALVATAKAQLRSLPRAHVPLNAALMTDHGGTKVVFLRGRKTSKEPLAHQEQASLP